MAALILIADDEKKIVDLVVRYLENAGFRTLSAFDGKTALRLWQQETPDCIILDINMPGLNGLDVAREIRKSSMVPLVFLSALTEEADRVVGLELGGDD
jgi:DNA-binding response OmpR family regulator